MKGVGIMRYATLIILVMCSTGCGRVAHSDAAFRFVLPNTADQEYRLVSDPHQKLYLNHVYTLYPEKNGTMKVPDGFLGGAKINHFYSVVEIVNRSGTTLAEGDFTERGKFGFLGLRGVTNEPGFPVGKTNWYFRFGVKKATGAFP